MPSSSRPGSPFVRRAATGLKRHGALASLVVADVATKVAAFLLLPHGEPVTVLPGLRLYLAVNEWGVMGGVHGMGAVTSKPAYTMLLAAGLVVLAWCILRLAASGLGFGRRVALGAAAFFGVAFVAEAGAATLPHLPLSAGFIVAAIRLAVLVLALSLYGASRVPRSRAPFTLLAAGALANSASCAYPPFEVVDFVMVPLSPLAALLGRKSLEAGGDAAVGVINLADLYLFAFPLVLAAWPLAAVLSLARGGRAGPGRRLAPPPAKG